MSETFGLEIYASNKLAYAGRAQKLIIPEAKERAEEQLRQKQSIQEYHMNQMALARAMTRLKVTHKQ